MRRTKELVGRVVGKVTLALVGASSIAGIAHAITTTSGDIKPVPILGSDVNLPQLISNIIETILMVAGVLAVVYLIWGGIQYVTAGGDAEKATKGRVAITNAIIGVVIIMASFAIYNYVIGGLLTGGQ